MHGRHHTALYMYLCCQPKYIIVFTVLNLMTRIDNNKNKFKRFSDNNNYSLCIKEVM